MIDGVVPKEMSSTASEFGGTGSLEGSATGDCHDEQGASAIPVVGLAGYQPLCSLDQLFLIDGSRCRIEQEFVQSSADLALQVICIAKSAGVLPLFPILHLLDELGLGSVWTGAFLYEGEDWDGLISCFAVLLVGR